ncbi:site-specific integrase [Acidiferrobacter sp. SPIII_3]|jgi:integrase|uniref:site-specific integrase n=1 Tax=Acidiferrobacter sp. SPIII_3 TaxID=1281578 RepID=UPI000D734608|nr:site-specific integrase [Acidiferrobacter sp. SPIII_3]AWP22757.1 site-specific integrase [Acidiferrobacter sp. SPIII_3]
MATFRKRPGPGGRSAWQAQIIRRGHEPQYRTFDTKAEAEAWARQIESEIDREVFVSRAEATRTTIAEALSRYGREVSSKKRGAVQEASVIAILAVGPLGRLTLGSLQSKDLAQYRDSLLADGYSPITIKRRLAILSHLYKIAIREWGMGGLVNPVPNVSIPKLNNARDRRLQGDEYARLMSAAATYGGEIGPLITWAIETAMRRGEIAAMRWDHLDGPSGPQCRQARVLLIPETKTGTPRRIPLSTTAVAILDALPRRIDGHVWSMRPDSISQAFERVCKAAGITGLTFHDLRHEAASRLSEKGFGAMEVAAITGHKTMQMVKRYTHFRAEDFVGRLG